MLARLNNAGIHSIERLLDLSPKHMRAVWGSVAGERMHFALHGYDIQAEPSKRGMFGHSRMLAPSARTLPTIKPLSRLLLIKAAYRMRRERFRANRVSQGLAMITRDGNVYWTRTHNLPGVADYSGIMAALGTLWTQAFAEISPRYVGLRADVCLSDLMPMSERQLDMLEDDEGQRIKAEALADAIHRMNERYANLVIYPGVKDHIPSDNIGMKISYGRIPQIRDRFQ